MSTTVIIVWIHFRDITNWMLNGAERKFKRRMADVEVQKCLDWLLEQKNDMEECPFGRNRQSIHEATVQHSQYRTKLQEYTKYMDKLKIKHTLTDEELAAMYNSYQTVQTLAEKKASCFEVMNGIGALEDQIQSLSTEFDNRAVHLTNLSVNNRKHNQQLGLSNESMARTTQNCISGVRRSWRWMDEVMQCAHVHLANAAAYHEYFHEVEEVDFWMNNIMSNMHLTFSRRKLDGDSADLSAMNEEMKDTLLAYLRWQSKVDNLFTRARDIVPVHKRVTPIKDPCPVLALTTYKTHEIEFQEGDTLTLLNNSDKKNWRVKNAADQIAVVPAVILLLNGPSGEAIDAALRLRIQLLSLWTTSVKRLGYQMIAFMQLVFRDWTPEEIAAIQRMPLESRENLERILKTIEQTLKSNWEGYQGFEDLQEKISRLRTILDEAKKLPVDKSSPPGQVVIQTRLLEDLLNHYQEFYTYWDTYKVVAEVLKQPKYILVCDRWDQLKYQSTAHFVRFWDTNLLMPQEKGGKTYKAEAAVTLHETPKEKLVEETIKSEVVDEVMTARTVDQTDSTVTDALAKLKNGDDGQYSTDVTEVRRRQQLTTDEVVSSTEEVRHTFIIRSVCDPRTQDDISLTDAVLAGIIDQAKGLYVNIVTGESYPLQAAMAQGDIIVEFKSQQTIREEKSSYGIITVKTIVETRPYTIFSVIDPETDKEISTEAAYEKNILDQKESTYKAKTGDYIPIIDAIQLGYIKAEFQGDEPENNQEDTKTYAVNSVVDQQTRQKVSFHAAIENGLLDGEEGVYVNNVTWERVPITEAIMRGFIKAKLITDPSQLDIDPSRKIVVRQLSNAQEKIMKAVKVSRAFKRNLNTNKSSVNGK